ncbi:hypothetical protein BGZ98_004531, partial [Dissophora globulifera]
RPTGRSNSRDIPQQPQQQTTDLNLGFMIDQHFHGLDDHTPPSRSHHLYHRHRQEDALYDTGVDTHTTLFTSSINGTVVPDSPGSLSGSRHGRRPFHLKSPRTPKMLSPGRRMRSPHSPRSPYEWLHRITPRRTRLRVDASAATRKALRARKSSLRKVGNGHGPLKQRYSRRHSGDLTIEDLSSSKGTNTSLHSRAAAPHSIPVPPATEVSRRHDHDQRRPTLPELPPKLDRAGSRSDSTAQALLPLSQPLPSSTTASLPLSLPSKAASFDLADLLDNSYKTPSRATSSRDQALSKRQGQGATRRTDYTNDSDNDDALDSRSTPGSRARDSMTLISPRNRLDSTPALTRGPSRSSGSLSIKRSSQDMDMDIDMDRDEEVEIFDAEYRRPRSSPFQDSVAPVRFDAREKDVLQPRVDIRLSMSKLGAPGRNSVSHSNSAGRTVTIDTKERLEDGRRQDSVVNTGSHSRPSEGVSVGTLRRPISIASSRRSRSHSEEEEGDSELDIVEMDMRTEEEDDEEEQISKQNSGVRSKTTRESVKSQGAIVSLGAMLDDTSYDSSITPVPAQGGQIDNSTTASMTFADDAGKDRLADEIPVTLKRDNSSTIKATSAGEAPRIASGIGAKSNVSETPKDSQSIPASTSKTPATSTSSTTTLPTKTTTTTSSSAGESVIPRSRIATTLPEKRTIGQRKPFTLMSGSQPQPPTSRLTKMGSTLSSTSSLSSSLAPSGAGSQSSSAHPPPNRLMRHGSTNLLREPGAGAGAGGSSLSSSSVRSGGILRAPLPSVVTKATESSLARAESTLSGQTTRKPFLTAKSLFAVKKPIRPVLPDSTLTAKSIALSGISRAGTVSPKKELGGGVGKRETLNPRQQLQQQQLQEQRQQQQQSREATPVQSNGTATATTSGITTTMTTMATTTTATAASKSSSGSMLSSTQQSAAKESSLSLSVAPTTTSSSNPFLIPAPIRPTFPANS